MTHFNFKVQLRLITTYYFCLIVLLCLDLLPACLDVRTNALNHMIGHIMSAWLECCIRVTVVSWGTSLCVTWNNVPDANQTSSGCFTTLSAEFKIWFAFMFRLRIKVMFISVNDRWFFSGPVCFLTHWIRATEASVSQVPAVASMLLNSLLAQSG